MIAEKIFHKKAKQIAVLLDPGKLSIHNLKKIIPFFDKNGTDFFLIGGSLLDDGLSDFLQELKNYTSKPAIIFPGSVMQISDKADALLFLTLLSGRNPDFLIGNHVIAAPTIKKNKIETISTGYILIDCGKTTSVEYISNTKPIPYDKTDIAVATALAGEMLGNEAIYLEGGSGADKKVSNEMIAAVKASISKTLIVGGGIRNKEHLYDVYSSGADIAVVGTALEHTPSLLSELEEVKNFFNKKTAYKESF